MVWSPASCQTVMSNKNCKLYLQFVSKSVVTKLLCNLSNGRCSAIEGLDNYSVKIAANVIAEPLHHIITLSIMQDKFPTEWKNSKVIPLHKK